MKRLYIYIPSYETGAHRQAQNVPAQTAEQNMVRPLINALRYY